MFASPGLRCLVLIFLLDLFGACSDKSRHVDAGARDAGARDAASDASTRDAASDAGKRKPDICDELDLERSAMRTTGTGNGFGEVAGDFTVSTLDGSWSLSDHFSGCESYVFFSHFPGVTDALIRTSPERLFLEGRRNVQYFFTSDDSCAFGKRA